MKELEEEVLALLESQIRGLESEIPESWDSTYKDLQRLNEGRRKT